MSQPVFHGLLAPFALLSSCNSLLLMLSHLLVLSVAPAMPKRKKQRLQSQESAEGGSAALDPVALSVIRSSVWRQLAPQFCPEELLGLEEQRAALTQVLADSLVQGQNNSVVVSGPRGSGKSVLLRHCLRTLRATYQAQARHFIEINLHGRIHDDDTLALREICHQLCDENELARLPDRSTIPAMLEFIANALEDHTKISQPVFFIFEEVDLFCTRGSQTLLYTVCDLLQSPRAQVAFIGLTSRQDFPQLLEKRLRSRLSYRRIFCPRMQSLDYLTTCLLQRMTYSQPPLASAPSSSASSQKSDMDPVANIYNKALEVALRDAGVQSSLEKAMLRGTPLPGLLFACVDVTAQLAAAKLPSAESFLLAFSKVQHDIRSSLIRECTDCELALLIAMTKMEERQFSSYNFALCLSECKEYLKRFQEKHSASTAPLNLDGPTSVLKAFEQLLDRGNG
eukprot:g493.t1